MSESHVTHIYAVWVKYAVFVFNVHAGGRSTYSYDCVQVDEILKQKKRPSNKCTVSNRNIGGRVVH